MSEVSGSPVETRLQAFRERVKPCPAPSEGVHRWLFHAACCAVEAGLPDDEARKTRWFRNRLNPNPHLEKRYNYGLQGSY